MLISTVSNDIKRTYLPYYLIYVIFSYNYFLNKSESNSVKAIQIIENE